MNAYPPSEWLALQRNDKGYQLPDESIAQLREWIDRYHVNAVQIPSPVGRVKDPANSPEDLRAWLAAWDKAITEIARPHVIFYIYLKDEPNDPEAYEFVRHWGKPIRAAQTKVKVLVVEQTLTQDPAWGDLYGAVDIWCSLFPLYDEATASGKRSGRLCGHTRRFARESENRPGGTSTIHSSIIVCRPGFHGDSESQDCFTGAE